MRPDIDEFIRTLRRGKGRYVPSAELGIHPEVKERYLGRRVLALADDVEFWHRATERGVARHVAVRSRGLPRWVRLTRRGNTFTAGSTSTMGRNSATTTPAGSVSSSSRRLATSRLRSVSAPILSKPNPATWRRLCVNGTRRSNRFFSISGSSRGSGTSTRTKRSSTPG